MSAFDEFKAYWAVAEEMIAKAIKEQVPEVARVLARERITSVTQVLGAS